MSDATTRATEPGLDCPHTFDHDIDWKGVAERLAWQVILNERYRIARPGWTAEMFRAMGADSKQAVICARILEDADREWRHSLPDGDREPDAMLDDVA